MANPNAPNQIASATELPNFIRKYYLLHQTGVINIQILTMKLLRSQGMSSEHLHQVTIALIISRLRYALPLWVGFLTIDLCNRIQGLLKRL